jgi:dual specificity MAP kinase phosphatase
MTGKVMDFFHWERLEMCSMTKPSQISRNIWMGPTPDPNLQHFADLRGENEPEFDIMIEASDLAQIPDAKAFKLLDDILDGKIRSDLTDLAIPQLEFPGSGAIMKWTVLSRFALGCTNRLMVNTMTEAEETASCRLEQNSMEMATVTCVTAIHLGVRS